jgi:hypothetical protein
LNFKIYDKNITDTETLNLDMGIIGEDLTVDGDEFNVIVSNGDLKNK